jgi:hypothetical protein
MSRQRLSALVLLGSLTLLASACDGGKESEPKSADDKPAKPTAKGDEKKPAPGESPIDQPSADWPTLAITKVDDEVDGIKFSISLPSDKLKREVKASDGTFPGYVTWNGANFLMDPSFTVQIDSFPPTDLEKAARLMHAQPAEVVRQEALEGGGFLVSFIEKNQEFVSVRAWRTSAATSKVVRVTLQVRNTGGIKNLDTLRPWMETVASSLVVQ